MSNKVGILPFRVIKFCRFSLGELPNAPLVEFNRRKNFNLLGILNWKTKLSIFGMYSLKKDCE